MFDVLQKPSVHENLIKVGAYILGEYGHLVADEPVSAISRAEVCAEEPALTHMRTHRDGVRSSSSSSSTRGSHCARIPPRLSF